MPLLAALSGCDSLLNRPGGDFAVTIASPMPLVVSQRVAPFEIVFDVTGCNDFETSVGVVTTEGSSSTVVETERRPDGLYIAKVPVSAIADPMRCRSTVDEPALDPKGLFVHCRDEGREAQANLTVSYSATYKNHYSGRGAVDTVLPGSRPGSFFTVGSGWLSYYDGGDQRGGEAVTAIDPNVRPRLVQRSDRVYLWAGCPLDSCGNVYTVDTPSLKVAVPATYLIPFELDQSAGTLGRAEAPIPVPGGVAAMTLLPSGEIAMLAASRASVQLTNVGVERISGVKAFEGEVNPTDFARLGDALVFLTTTLDGSMVRMRSADGTLRGEHPLEGRGPVTFLTLAPSGDQWVYTRSREVRVGSLGAPTRLLDTRLGTDDRFFGAVWLTSHIGLWSSNDQEAPELHPRVAGTQGIVKVGLTQSRQSAPVVRAGLGLDDAFGIVTSSGVEIFDTAGHSIGGADPFDNACGRPSYLGPEATVLDGDTVALGGATYVSLFRPIR